MKKMYEIKKGKLIYRKEVEFKSKVNENIWRITMILKGYRVRCM